ncbi:hypothetical protein Dalk_5160 [Desulfatibacillum aliphaticivorans]|uniref:DUF2007 domain-containing protein n=1 Tax=Desulfatibacillum aliphaticivorans TaxID=218208 RepID=B8FE49_DESAL|nr:hypothetical protein [Desulfatibacillum aliphaticivorans]ACL06830.1 hypothetical protein Dalk_5160 [Desulfatibacillum aliphaticivorans]
MSDVEVVNVATLENEIEARLLGAILDEKEIVHTILSYHDTAYDGMYQVQKGWGVVRAEQEYKEEIRAILEDLRSGEGMVDMPESDDDDED